MSTDLPAAFIIAADEVAVLARRVTTLSNVALELQRQLQMDAAAGHALAPDAIQAWTDLADDALRPARDIVLVLDTAFSAGRLAFGQMHPA